MILIAAAVPHVASLLEPVTHLGCVCVYVCVVWYGMQLWSSNAFFSVPVYKNYQRQLTSSWPDQQYTFAVLPQGHISFPSLRHNFLQRELIIWVFPQNITLAKVLVTC